MSANQDEEQEATAGGVPAPSSTERIKLASDGLRGTLAPTIASDATHFGDDDAVLLKFHGIYQQDDRDKRVKRGEQNEPAWQMMIRLTIPGGVLTADQYLALDALADRLGNGTLRITTRQSIQYHGVLKKNLKPLIAEINSTLLTTIAACGDVSRNVMASPEPIDDEAHRDVLRVANEIALELRPQTGAYFEIWLDGERVTDSRDNEPVYGDSYLPRKYKVGVALDTDNSIDVYSYDCGLVGVTEHGRVVGYNVLAGGGFGMTHNKANTFARVASTIGFVEPQHATAAVRAVCEIYRDEGNRSDRKHARLKYLVEQWGVERFAAELQRRVAFEVRPPANVPAPLQKDYLGVHPQGNGKFYAGVFVQSGRVADRGDQRARSAFRAFVERARPGVRLTPMQSILFTDLSASDVTLLHDTLRAHGVPAAEEIGTVTRHSMACPALPTCGLSLAESERALPDVLKVLEAEFTRLGIQDIPLTVRMTGCPNGCARPYNADIGFVGRRPGVYHVFVGGGLRGDRLADLFASDVKVDQLLPSLQPLLERYSRERRSHEGLSDFYHRARGSASTRTLLTGQEKPSGGFFLPVLPS